MIAPHSRAAWPGMRDMLENDTRFGTSAALAQNCATSQGVGMKRCLGVSACTRRPRQIQVIHKAGVEQLSGELTSAHARHALNA